MCDVLTGCLIVWNLSVLDVLNWKKKKNENHGNYLIWLDFKIQVLQHLTSPDCYEQD